MNPSMKCKKMKILQIIVNRISNIPSPHRLHSPRPTIRPNIPPKPTPSHDLTKPIHISIQRQRTRQLKILILKHQREAIQLDLSPIGVHSRNGRLGQGGHTGVKKRQGVGGLVAAGDPECEWGWGVVEHEIRVIFVY